MGAMTGTLVCPVKGREGRLLRSGVFFLSLGAIFGGLATAGFLCILARAFAFFACAVGRVALASAVADEAFILADASAFFAGAFGGVARAGALGGGSQGGSRSYFLGGGKGHSAGKHGHSKQFFKHNGYGVLNET